MISLLIPTRHHLRTLPRAVESLLTLSAGPLEILLGVDEDDVETAGWATARPGVTALVAPRPDTVGAVTNRLAAAARGDLFLGFADDMEVVTPAWDALIEAVAAHVAPSGEPFAFYLDDPTHPGFPSVWGVNRAWARICGFVCAPWFPYWWGDTWIHEVGSAAGRLFAVPAGTRQIEGRGTTTGMRDIEWWAAFFERTRPLRMQMAEAISHAVHPPEIQPQLAELRALAARAFAEGQAQAQAGNRAAQLHQALGAGDAPGERYLRAKAAAERFLKECGMA